MTLALDFNPRSMLVPIDYEDIRSYIIQQNQSKNQYITKLYQNYYMYRMDRAADLAADDERWRTNVKYPITHMFVTRIYNMLLKTDLIFRVTDKFESTRTSEKEKRIAEDMNALMSRLFLKEETKSAFWSAVLDAILIGRWVLRVSYQNTKYMREFLDKNGDKKKREVVKDYPILEYESAFDKYFDPGGKTLMDMRFIITRKLIAATRVKDFLKKYGIELKEAEVLEKNNYISYEDFNAEKFNMPFNNVEPNRDNAWPRNITQDDQYAIKNKTCEIILVSDSRNVTIWVGSVLHGTVPEIWPQEWYREKIIHYKKNPGTLYSLGVWYLCFPIQEVYDIIGNLRVDNVKLAVNKTFLVSNALNIGWNNKKIKLKPWLMYKVDDVNQVQELSISEVKESAYKEADVMFSLVQAMTGVASNVLWLQTKVERTAGGAETLQNAADDQLLPIMDSIADVMGDVFKEFMVLCLTYMDEAQIDKILWPGSKFKELNIEDLLNDYEFDFYMNSQNNKADAATRAQLINTIQILQNTVDAAGNPVKDIRPLVDKLVESFDVADDTELTEEKLKEMMVVRWMIDQIVPLEVQERIAKLQEKGKLPGGWQTGEAAMMAAQTAGAGNVPPAMTTNASWVNA